MKIKILKEAGHDEAMLGMALSYYDNSEPLDAWWTIIRLTKAIARAEKLAHMHGGHNKFLEHIEVWIHVKAPLSFWKQADTYRISSKQSSSTMHTLNKQIPLTHQHFSEDTHPAIINTYNTIVNEEKDILKLADNLPDGFLQDRIWKMSYKTLQNIISQREGHRLKHWKAFGNEILKQIKHPEYLVQ